MSKTYDTLSKHKEALSEQSEQQQKKQEVATVASPSTVPEAPEDLLAELQQFRKAAAQNSRPSFFGKIGRFRKGVWLLGAEKEQIPDRSRWIGVMGHAYHGLISWETVTAEDGSTKRVPRHEIGKIIEGYQPPPRETLGDNDKSQWKIGLDGKLEDPWKPVVYLPFLSLNGEKVWTFTTSTKTGLPRFWQLMGKYSWIGQKHLGQYPILELQASGYEDRRFGWIHVPDWGIVDWVGRPDPERLLGHADDGGGSGDGSEEPPPYDIIPEEYDEQV